MRVCARVCADTHTRVHNIRVCVCLSVCVRARVRVHTRGRACVCVCVSVHGHGHACLWVSTCTHSLMSMVFKLGVFVCVCPSNLQAVQAGDRKGCAALGQDTPAGEGTDLQTGVVFSALLPLPRLPRMP